MAAITPAVWTEPYGETLSSKILEHLSTRHALRGGALGLELLSHLRRGDIEYLVRYPVHEYQSQDGLNPLELANVRQMLGFYQKNSTLSLPGVDPEAAAKQSWLEAEAQCQSTNALIKGARGHLEWPDDLSSGEPPKWTTSVSLVPNFVKLLTKMRGLIKTALGPAPSIDELDLRYGPGSTDRKSVV